MIPIRDTAPCHSTPIVTWVIMAICTCVFGTMYFMPGELSARLIYLYGMVPSRYENGWAGSLYLPFDGYLSFMTNLFLHASWLHLLMNLWFLWIFADNVEDRMGHLPFLAFYLLCAFLPLSCNGILTRTLPFPWWARPVQ